MWVEARIKEVRPIEFDSVIGFYLIYSGFYLDFKEMHVLCM